jgi:hypothetical protein
VASPNLEALALRAVEIMVLGREDQRLLVATKRRLTRPKRIARLLAGLTNAARGRHAVLLLGVRRDDVAGLDALPDADWWDDLEDAFPGPVPPWTWSVIDIDGAKILAIAPEPMDQLVPAAHRGEIMVPFFERGGIRRLPPADSRRPSTPESMATASVTSGWVQRSVVDRSDPIAVFRGRLTIEISSGTGQIDDAECSATLLSAGREDPVGLDVQLHPSDHEMGVFRQGKGVAIRSDVRVDVLLAAAVRGGLALGDGKPVQLVVSLALPGSGVPELRSMLLNPDPGTVNCWTL